MDRRGEDFLKKLRVKPGIGRPYRYKINNTDSAVSNCPTEIDKPSVQEPAVTVEQLFCLPKEDLTVLFAEQTKQKIRNAASPLPPRATKSVASTLSAKKSTHKDLSKGENPSSTSVWLTKSSQKTLHCQSCFSFAQSKKPLRCPHDPCKKTVAVSSFLNHFKHEHPNIQRYNVDRGMQLVIPCNASHIEHDVTFCLAMITVYDVGSIKLSSKTAPHLANVCNRLNTKVPINTFWLLVSGSPEEKFSLAYALYWLFTSNNNDYTCTLEMASANDTTSYSTFCCVNGTNESQEIVDVAQRLNCLYLTKGSMMALLQDGSDLRLGITIH